MHSVRAEACAHLHTQVERLSTENLGVDRSREFWQTVKPFRCRPVRKPVEIAVRSSDVTIDARRDVNDDLWLLWHVAPNARWESECQAPGQGGSHVNGTL